MRAATPAAGTACAQHHAVDTQQTRGDLFLVPVETGVIPKALREGQTRCSMGLFPIAAIHPYLPYPGLSANTYKTISGNKQLFWKLLKKPTGFTKTKSREHQGKAHLLILWGAECAEQPSYFTEMHALLHTAGCSPSPCPWRDVQLIAA